MSPAIPQSEQMQPNASRKTLLEAECYEAQTAKREGSKAELPNFNTLQDLFDAIATTEKPGEYTKICYAIFFINI